MTIDVINEKRIKVALNGGALNPKGLAEKVAALVSLLLTNHQSSKHRTPANHLP